MACIIWQLPDGSHYLVAENSTHYPSRTGAVNTGRVVWNCGPEGEATKDELEKHLEENAILWGDAVAWVTKKLGMSQCSPCKARQEILNNAKTLGWAETLKQLKATVAKEE